MFLDDISFSYEEGLSVLEHVSLHVHRGEFVCIVGANGSGKSTLAKHLNALLLPNHGVVSISGMDTSLPENVKEIRKTVAMVFQNPDDCLVATIVEDEIAFGPGNLNINPDELRTRVGECLKAVDLANTEKRDVNTLSGGQKQRVAIAGALAMSPSALVLDEATSMLDPEGRRTIMDIVHALHQQGMTIIMITHSMEEALEADRLVLMKDGRIIADGTPRAILSDKELVEDAGMKQPKAAIAASLLRSKGIQVPITCHEHELKEVLCSLYSTR